jgi:hypothetical protein
MDVSGASVCAHVHLKRVELVNQGARKMQSYALLLVRVRTPPLSNVDVMGCVGGVVGGNLN